MFRLFLQGILVFMLCSVSCFSQQSEFIEGKLIDSESTEPVVFATIRIKNKAVGVISNMDGTFKIPTRFKAIGDSLEVSSLGYVSKNIALSALSESKVNLIELSPAVEQLNEVVVKGKGKKPRRSRLSADDVVRLAIKSIAKNYPHSPYSYVGYYRDYQIKNEQYFNLNEAIIEIFDQGFGSNDYATTKSKMYGYTRNSEFPRDTVAERPYDYQTGSKTIIAAKLNDYGGNEFVILRAHDALRNHALNSYDFVNRLHVDFRKNHSFEFAPNLSFGNEILYSIVFSKTENTFSAQGTIYISKSDLSIHGLEYALYEHNGMEGFKASSNGGSKKIFETKVAYRRFDGMMYLNYISMNNIFKFQESPELAIKSFSVNREDRCFEIRFTNSLAINNSDKLRYYNIKYEGKQIEYNKIELDGELVKLYPKFGIGDELAVLFLFGTQKYDSDDFEIDIKGIKDIEGNRYNVSKTSENIQFREFFVQEVKPNGRALKEASFIDKSRPIFEDQPIEAPENYEDYWMNTPLKTTENKNRL